VELAVALGRGGRDIAEDTALEHVWGYGVALDMTRRDLQGQAKALGRPWEVGKAFDHSAPIGLLVPATTFGHPQAAAIRLTVNGVVRQEGDVNQMIWTVPEMIALLSRLFTLAPGDLILTGTPAGVGPVVRGDALVSTVAGLPPLHTRIV
jgi:fumarylpyruvate hydrolase